MAVCTLSIPPDTEQVRVARLVACAAARRTGLIEAQIDDVRLAVGEAVGRAVVRQQREDAPDPVSVRMIDDAAGFVVEVSDTAAAGPDESPLAMALITGLVPLVQVYEDDTAGQVVRMQWAADADVGQQP
jgi:serine/threonine-protein kinase RsbW